MSALLTIDEARRLLTPETCRLLEAIGRSRPECYMPDALIEAGVSPRIVGAMLADHPEYPVVSARRSLMKAGRTDSRAYIWSVDIPSYLRGWQ